MVPSLLMIPIRQLTTHKTKPDWQVLYEDAEDIVLENPPEAHSLLLSAAETLRHVIASGYNDVAFHLTLAKVLSFLFHSLHLAP